MTDRKISLGQWLTVLTLALFTLGTEEVSRLGAAGAAAWLCPLLAGAAALAGAAWVSRKPLLGRGDLGAQIAACWGRRTGRVLATLFLLWGLWLTAAHGARIGGRLSDSLRASPLLVTGAVLLLAGWLAAGGVPAFARTCEIFALAVGVGFLLLVLFGVARLDGTQVLLWTRAELGQVPRGACAAGGVVAAGGYALVLLGDIRPQEGGRRLGLRRLGGLFLSLAAAVLLVLGRLGAALAGRIDRPFFQMVSGLGFEGAFQRLEELVSALWVLGDVALLGLLLLCLGRLLAQVLDRPSTGALVWAAAGAVFLSSGNHMFWEAVLAGPVLPAGNLAALGGMTLCLVWSRAKQEKFEKLEKRG